MVDVQRIIVDLVGLLHDDETSDSDSSDANSPNLYSQVSSPGSATERLALASCSGRTLLHLSAALGFHDLLRILMHYKVELDRCDISGRTALHYAALYGHLECARCLLDRGASAHLNDRWGYLAQELAAESDHHDIEEMFALASVCTMVR